MKTTTVRKFLFLQIQRLAAGGVFSLAVFWAGGVQAVPLDFFCITNTLPGDCAIGEAQLGVDVTSFGIGTGVGGVDQVLFTFTNTGADMSTISEIYFDDGSLLGLAGLIDADDGIGGDAGVDFSQGATRRRQCPPACSSRAFGPKLGGLRLTIAQSIADSTIAHRRRFGR